MGARGVAKVNVGQRVSPSPAPRVETPSPSSEAGSTSGVQAYPGETACRAGPHPGRTSWTGQLRARRETGVTGWPVQSPAGWCCLTCGWQRTCGRKQAQGVRAPATPGQGHQHATCLSPSVQVTGLTSSHNPVGAASPCQGSPQPTGVSVNYKKRCPLLFRNLQKSKSVLWTRDTSLTSTRKPSRYSLSASVSTGRWR